MKICHIATELSPVAKVGGLADVTLGLGRALQKKQHDVFLILPKYACLKTEGLNELKAYPSKLNVLFGGKTYPLRILSAKVENLQVFFIDSKAYCPFFDREKIYGYKDDALRFAFFSLAALQFLNTHFSNIDVIHFHEWHTALIAPLVKTRFSKDFHARLIYTIHNLGYQGQSSYSLLKKVGLHTFATQLKDSLKDPKIKNKINLMKGAILLSDAVTTVSPTYAREICNPPYSKGLEKLIIASKDKLMGILNGIDQEVWNPSLDPSLSTHYSSSEFQNKKYCKKALQMSLGLPPLSQTPLVICICRLVPQKGLRMIRKAIHVTLKLKGQFILFGSSPIPKIQKEFELLKSSLATNPNVCFIFDSYNEPLAHQIYAGADMLICPSIFEPCGLTQIIALRYGTVPIVRKTGGLADTVFDLENDLDQAEKRNGFNFSPPTSKAMEETLKRAFTIYHFHPEKWKEMIQRGMSMDFGWNESADKYLSLYQHPNPSLSKTSKHVMDNT